MINKKLSVVTLTALMCVLFAAAGAARAAGTPIVYSNAAPGGETSIARLQESFGNRVTAMPLPAGAQFVPARLITRSVHPYIREVGRVKIVAVADVDGRVRDPVVVESTNPRLNIMMRNSVSNWVCVPARLNGTAVRTVMQSTIVVRWRAPVQIYSR